MKKAFDKVTKRTHNKDKVEDNSIKNNENKSEISSRSSMIVENRLSDESNKEVKIDRNRFNSLKLDRLKNSNIFNPSKLIKSIKKVGTKEDKIKLSEDQNYDSLDSADVIVKCNYDNLSADIYPHHNFDSENNSYSTIDEITPNIITNKSNENTNDTLINENTNDTLINENLTNQDILDKFIEYTNQIRNEINQLSIHLENMQDYNNHDKINENDEDKYFHLQEQINLIVEKLDNLETKFSKQQDTFQSVDTYFCELERKWGSPVLRCTIPIMLFAFVGISRAWEIFAHREYIIPLLVILLLWWLKKLYYG